MTWTDPSTRRCTYCGVQTHRSKHCSRDEASEQNEVSSSDTSNISPRRVICTRPFTRDKGPVKCEATRSGGEEP